MQIAITSKPASALAVPAMRLLPPGAALTFNAWRKTGHQLGIADAPPLAGMATVRALMTCDQPELDCEFHELFGQMASQIAPPAAVAHALAFADGYLARTRHDHHRATGAPGDARTMAAKPATIAPEPNTLRAAVDVAANAFTQHQQRLAALKSSVDGACHRIIELQAERERAAIPLPATATLEEHESASFAAADALARADVRVGYFRKLAASNAVDVVPCKHRVLQAENDLAQALSLFWLDRQRTALADLRSALQAPLLALVAATLRTAATRGRFEYVDLDYVLKHEVMDLLTQTAEEARANADTAADRILATRPQTCDLVTWDERRDPGKVGPTFGDPVTPQDITAMEADIAIRLRSIETRTREIAEKQTELAQLETELAHAELKAGNSPRTSVTVNPWVNDINALKPRIERLQRSIELHQDQNAKAPAEIASKRRELDEARTALELAQALAE